LRIHVSVDLRVSSSLRRLFSPSIKLSASLTPSVLPNSARGEVRWRRRGGRLPSFLRYCCSDLLVRSSTSIDFSVCLTTVSVLSGVFFMSERDSFYVGSIGLLGEYCPTSRKKYICSLERASCLHLEPFRETTLIGSCSWEQLFFIVTDYWGIEQKRFLVPASIV
ncbi:unnamed protein product, partial [Musa acuminata subsp. burmannicoides]